MSDATERASDATERASDATERTSDAKERACRTWLLKHGATMDAIQWPQDLGNSRGAVATKRVGPGDTLLTVPEALMMTPAKARAALPDLRHASFDGKDDLVLALFLAHERGLQEASFWHPYIDSLPDPDGLARWTRPDLDELQDQELVRESQHKAKVLRRLYEELCRAFPDLLSVERWPRFEWASMIVSSRAFGRRLEHAALVPLADALNHEAVQTKYEFEDGVFRLFASGKYTIQPGQEAFNSYGRIANRDLLLHYGFALDKNTWDYVRIKLLIGDNVPLASRKREVLALSELKSPSDLFAIAAPPEVLVRFFRIVALSPGEVQLVKDFPRGPGNAIAKPVSLDSEHKALHAAAACVEALYVPLPTTERQDEALLARAAPASRLQAAIRYRQGKKRILRCVAQYLRQMAAVVERLLDGEAPLKQLLDVYPAAQKAVLRRVYLLGVDDVGEVLDELEL